MDDNGGCSTWFLVYLMVCCLAMIVLGPSFIYILMRMAVFCLNLVIGLIG